MVGGACVWKHSVVKVRFAPIAGLSGFRVLASTALSRFAD